jgi:hypothetical protein
MLIPGPDERINVDKTHIVFTRRDAFQRIGRITRSIDSHIQLFRRVISLVDADGERRYGSR